MSHAPAQSTSVTPTPKEALPEASIRDKRYANCPCCGELNHGEGYFPLKSGDTITCKCGKKFVVRR
jgi:hypothetical protein